MTDDLVVPGLNTVEQAHLSTLWSQLRRRARRNLVRAAYYDGKHAPRFFASSMAPQYQQLGVVLGWNAKAVDMLARRCNLDGFYWPDGDLDEVGLPQVESSNRLGAELKSAMVSSLIHGVAFLISTQGIPGEPQALLHVRDALSTTATWNARTRQLDAALSITDWSEDRPLSLTLYLDGLTVIAERSSPSSAWSVDRSTHPWGVPVEPLVYRPRVGRELGTSRITRATMALQDMAVRALLRMEGHMDVYAIPQMILLGADESLFKNPDGSQKASWQIALGRVFAIPDNLDEAGDSTLARADVRQFAAQSPQPHLAQLSALAKLFARETALPDSALAITDMANPTSADAYVAANEDLIAEAEGATDDWALPITRAVARSLAVLNDGRPEDYASLGVRWRSPMHLSRAAAADAGMKQLAAAPWLAETEVGLELLGLSESQIQRALAERARAQGRATLTQILAAG